ncbi:MAG: sulfatase-like hydrolase/transferase [Parvibaculaceae bacterium]|nr:sulfatase-like hydrolase/transferase [Parvibaculaceae bacterium]
MKLKKALIASASVLLVLGVAAWVNRIEIILNTPGIIANIIDPVGPHQEVLWQSGETKSQLMSTSSAAKRKPNIIFIVSDDMGFNDISYYGGGASGTTMQTPNIDALANEGVAFLNGYAGNAVCAPSRAMIMTGRYATRFGFEFTPTPPGMPQLVGLVRESRGLQTELPFIQNEEVYDEVPAYADLGMPTSEVTIAELLKSAGYYTAHIGKWHLGRNNGMGATAQGFDDSLLMASGLYLPVDHPDAVNSRQEFDPIDLFLWPNMRYAASFNDGSMFEPKGYITDYYTDEAIKVIEGNKDRPFFLYLAHWGIHTPLQALKSDYDALSDIKDHRLRVYTAMTRAVDRSVGRVMQALKDNGLDENTLVIFTSDNGGAGYVGLPDLNKPYRGWKITLFEGGTHVPFFAHWPSVLPHGARFDKPVSHLDLFATAAAAAGVAMPTDRKMDGVNLVPYIRGEKSGTPHEKLFWSDGGYQSVLKEGWKLQVSALRDKKWLFDLSQDPTEQNNLVAQEPKKAAELMAELKAHKADQRTPRWPWVGALPVPIDKTLAQQITKDDEFILWEN